MDNSTVNDIVIYGIDQFLPQERLQKDIFNRVDDIVASSVENGNPDDAFKAMKSLLGVSQISGIAFAKFVYVMKFQWDKFASRQTFEEMAEDVLGRGKKAIKDNNTVWEFLVSGDVSKEYCEKFKTMPIRCLIPIANLWKQEWEVEPHQWMMLSQAPDPTTINKIIREIKKVEPKKDSLQIQWDAEAKCLTVWKNNKPSPIYLQYDENNVDIQAALERLLSGKVIE